MNKTTFCTLLFSLFAASCVVTSSPDATGSAQMRVGQDSLAGTSTLQGAAGGDVSGDPEPQPWLEGRVGGDVAGDPEPQPWRSGGVGEGRDPEPQPWRGNGESDSVKPSDVPTGDTTRK